LSPWGKNDIENQSKNELNTTGIKINHTIIAIAKIEYEDLDPEED
jgi:hypothetical protein